jgi:glycosyltransferase involved in cell wall biosynthesis
MTHFYHSRLDENIQHVAERRDTSILNVGTIALRKGQHILAEAFSRIAVDFPEWDLNLVGELAEPACINAIESIRRNCKLEARIHLHGPHTDPTSFYRSAGIYVQPSLLEGLGLSLQEAMFHGIPSAGADCGGIPELIDSLNVGRIFASGNSGVLADVLVELISDPALRKRLGAAGHQSILSRGMTRQAMCSAYRKLYDAALNSSIPYPNS